MDLFSSSSELLPAQVCWPHTRRVQPVSAAVAARLEELAELDFAAERREWDLVPPELHCLKKCFREWSRVAYLLSAYGHQAFAVAANCGLQLRVFKQWSRMTQFFSVTGVV